MAEQKKDQDQEGIEITPEDATEIKDADLDQVSGGVKPNQVDRKAFGSFIKQTDITFKRGIT